MASCTDIPPTTGFAITTSSTIASKSASIHLGMLALGMMVILLRARPRFKIIRFKFFDELYELMRQEISSGGYDVVIHSAAVADYVPTKCHDGKIKSGQKDLVIKLKPTVKIVDQVKKWDSEVFLVKFKVESNVSKEELVQRAYQSMLASNADLIVANDLEDIGERRHKALIIDLNRKLISSETKEEIAKNLLDIIAQRM